MKLPNFIVLGAEKAGTTALYNNLLPHPQIHLGPKEPEFFTFEGTDSPRAKAHTLDAYARLFEGAGDEPVVGDVSTSYLACPEAPARIQKYVPDAKMVAILRDPVDRAYSRFWMRLHKNPDLLPYTPEKFREFFRNAQQGPLSVRRRGFYGEQLGRYFERFPRERIRVYLYEDYQSDGPGVMKDILQFLGVEESFALPNAVHGASGLPRLPVLRWLNEDKNWNPAVVSLLRSVLPRQGVRRLRRFLDRVNVADKPRLDPETRSKLIDHYRADILKLQELLGRDLSAWLTVRGSR